MKIFITGIAGFIGMHTALALKAKGHEVSGIDDFNDFYNPRLKFDRMKKLREAGVGVLHGDIRHFPTMEWILVGMDAVIHLAAYANPRHAVENPHLYVDVNIKGTQCVIDAAEKAEVSKVVYASTSCVMYGNPIPWNEECTFHHHESPYGWTKFANECQFLQSKIPSTVGLRFFTVYGPWGRPDMALWSFADKIVANEVIELYNYGNMRRDFTYVDDIVQGILLTVETPMEKQHELFNIGRGEPVELSRFVTAISVSLGGRKVDVELVPAVPGDVPETWADTTKIQKLGYKPTTSIEEGVEKFISWYKTYHGIN